MITQKKLKKLLKYKKKKGIFIWKSRNGSKAKNSLAGSIDTNGYISIGILNEQYRAHRLAWLYVYGEFPKNHLDHINHDKLDNRISNLREVTNKTNHKNRTKNSNNTSGITGVSWNKLNKKWFAQIIIDKKNIYLGSFIEFHEAVNARKNAEVLYGFHKNHGKDEIWRLFL